MNLNEIKQKKDNAVSECLKTNGVFFAFSTEQFEKNKTPLEAGDKYADIGMGGFIPKSKVGTYLRGMKDLMSTFEKDIEENNMREQYVLYELNNHEAFYTMSIESTQEALIGSYTPEEIWGIYRKYNAKKYITN